jgi:phosphatidate cytidylyltransferase
MKRVLTAAVLIPLVLLLILKGSFPVLTIVCAVVAGLAAWELLALADASGAKTPRISVLVALAMLFLCAYLRPDYLAPMLGALSFFLFVVCAFRSPSGRVLLDTGSSLLALVYTGFAMVSVPLINRQENGPSLLLLLVLVVWTGDIAALYVGRTLGRHKLAPALSPNKTWEGSVGSVLGSLAITAVLLEVALALGRGGIDLLSYPGSLAHWLGLAVLLNLAAQLGDLIESAIKRGAGMKDSGTLLPGHGGVLDRIDALLLAAPVLWYAQVAQGF